MPLTLGAEDLIKTRLILLTVVYAPSIYNVTLGRLAINAFMDIASKYHQKKYPVGKGVVKVRGD